MGMVDVLKYLKDVSSSADPLINSSLDYGISDRQFFVLQSI